MSFNKLFIVVYICILSYFILFSTFNRKATAQIPTPSTTPTPSSNSSLVFDLIAPNGTLNVDSTVDFVINIDTGPNTIQNAKIMVAFDQNVLQYVSTDLGNIFSTGSIVWSNTGRFIINAQSISPYAGSTVFATLHFKVLSVPLQGGGLVSLSNPTQNTNCLADINKTINITPLGASTGCHNLQEAIDAVNGDGYTIKVMPGSYTVPQSGLPYSINIVNKSNLKILGDQLGSPATKILSFGASRGGIFISNSTGTIDWLTLEGTTNNGLLHIKNSPSYTLSYLNLSDKGANTIQIESTANTYVVNSDIWSYATPIYLTYANSFKVFNNIIHGGRNAILAYNSFGTIDFNLIAQNAEDAIGLTGPNNITIESNTIVGNGTDLSRTLTGVVRQTNPLNQTNNVLTIRKNIIANNRGGIEIERPADVNYLIELNDVWQNITDYFQIPNQTGINNNISTDPLFGNTSPLTRGSYCLSSTSSPAYNQTGWIGYTGLCNNPITPPPPPITPEPVCGCGIGNNCNPGCFFLRSSTISYPPLVSCNSNPTLYIQTPNQSAKDNWCMYPLRTMGDANGDDIINNLDYFYYVSTVNGGKITQTVNPDVNGDGEVGSQDRVIILNSIGIQ